MDQQALLDLSCFISKMSLRRSPDKAIELETGEICGDICTCTNSAYKNYTAVDLNIRLVGITHITFR